MTVTADRNSTFSLTQLLFTCVSSFSATTRFTISIRVPININPDIFFSSGVCETEESLHALKKCSSSRDGSDVPEMRSSSTWVLTDTQCLPVCRHLTFSEQRRLLQAKNQLLQANTISNGRRRRKRERKGFFSSRARGHMSEDEDEGRHTKVEALRVTASPPIITLEKLMESSGGSQPQSKHNPGSSAWAAIHIVTHWGEGWWG